MTRTQTAKKAKKMTRTPPKKKAKKMTRTPPKKKAKKNDAHSTEKKKQKLKQKEIFLLDASNRVIKKNLEINTEFRSIKPVDFGLSFSIAFF